MSSDLKHEPETPTACAEDAEDDSKKQHDSTSLIHETQVGDTRDVKNGTEKTAEYSNTCSMFVTMLGYSIGVSDIWRFPFLVYRNGGRYFLLLLKTQLIVHIQSAFLIPFVITLVFCGIPLYFLEFSISNFSGKGPYSIWDISPVFRGVGVSVTIAYFLWLVGSSVFRCWLAMFLLDSFSSPLPWTHCNNPWNTKSCRDNLFVDSRIRNMSFLNNTFSPDLTALTSSNLTSTATRSSGMTSAEEYWQFKAINLSTGMTDLSPILWKHILCMIVLRLAVYLSLVKSIKSIEKVMYFAMFVPLTFQLVIMIQSLTLPGVGDGLYEFFYPDFSKLKSAKIWIEAFLMAFYTLNFGWGVILTMGSHANFHDNSVRTSVLVPLLDGLSAIFSGAVCFMVLGNMAHAYGVKVYDVIDAGFSAGVVSYISALSILPVPQVWTFSFIFTAILMGLDSQLVPLEMCLQVLGEMYPSLYPKYRFHTLTIVSILLFVFSLPTCTGAGGYIFLWLDWYTAVWIGPICAFIELIVVGWIYGIDRFSMDISLMTGKPAPWFFRFFIVFFAPVVVAVIFLTACVEYTPPKYGSYLYPTWTRALGWLFVFGILSPILIKAISVVYKQKGSLKSKIKESAKCSSLWRPKVKKVCAYYDSQRSLFKDKTLKEMVYFIMIGHHKGCPHSGIEKELSILVDNRK